MATIGSVNVLSYLTVSEIKAYAAAAGTRVASDAFNNTARTYNTASTPPVSQHFAVSATLAGSGAQTDTIDLTSFEDVEGIAKDGTGLRVQVVRIVAPSTNTGVLTVGDGANGYALFGSGVDQELRPGAELLTSQSVAAQLPLVAAGAKNVDVSGTGGDSYKIQILLG